MKLRPKTVFCLAIVGLACLVVPNVSLADSFDWTYQGTMLDLGVLSSGSGELNTTDGVITELSGTFNGLDITALLAPGAFAGNDNLLQIPPAPLFVTPNGFSFLDSAGDQINIYAVLGTQCICGPSGCVCVPDNVYGSASDDGNFDTGNFTLAPVATPEPGTVSMMFSGLLGLGLLAGMKRLRQNPRASEA
jgi:hypothetical protein